MNAAKSATSGAAIPQNPAPNTSADYFSVIHPPCPVICGRKLKPLTLERYNTIKRLRVAFVSEEQVVATARDLMLGVLICSTTSAEFNSILASETFDRDLDRWLKQFHFIESDGRWHCFSWPIIGPWLKRFTEPVIGQRDLEFIQSEIARFAEYITQNSVQPEYEEEETGQSGRVSGTHWAHSVEVVLRSSLGWRDDDFARHSLNKAVWDYFRHMESQGVIRLRSSEESAYIRENADKPNGFKIENN